MTSPSHLHTKARVQPSRNTYNHTYIKLLPGNPLLMIETLTATGWGKQGETLMATYKAVMRPALPYGRLMHPRPALTNCKSCIENCHRMLTRHKHTSAGQNTHTSHTRAPTAPRVTIQTKNTTSITPLTQTYNILQHSMAKNTIFNNRHKQTCAIYIPLGNNKILCIPLSHISSSEKLLSRLTDPCPTQKK